MQTLISGLIVHRAVVLDGEVTVGGLPVRVDTERRRSISRAHTATHMVHKAFRRCWARPPRRPARRTRPAGSAL
ncbi:MAG: hypothetical protein R2734_00375 [Nocardioides sp.]